VIAAQVPLLSGSPNRPPRGAPVLGGGNFILGATIQSVYRYFSGAYDDPSDTVRYSITSSNPSVISFTNGTDVTSSQPVTVNVLQNVTAPVAVSCTITTKDRFGVAGVSNTITITVGQLVNRLWQTTSDTTFNFPASATNAIIYVQAQGGGGGGGGAGRNYPGQPAYAGSGGVCGSPGNLTIASFYGTVPTSTMTLRVGNSINLGGDGSSLDTGTVGTTGEVSSVSSSFLNVTANGGIGGNGGLINPFQPGTADGQFGSIPTKQSSLASGSGSGTGWTIDSSYSGTISGEAYYPSKSGDYASGGVGKPYNDSLSTYYSVFGAPYGKGGGGGGGGYGTLNSPLMYIKGEKGGDPQTGIIRIEYIELI
jgi:hypothetical protein